MNTASSPRLSVTVTVFTSFDQEHPSHPAVAQLDQGPGGVDSFGTALWVLTRKANEPGAYQTPPSSLRVLPASLVGATESLSDTAARILRDEIGVDVTYRLRQSRIFDDVDPGAEDRVISVNYWTFVHIDALAPLLGGKEQVGLQLVSSSHSLENWSVMTKLEDFDGVSRFGLRFAPDHPNALRKQLTVELWGSPTLDGSDDQKVFYAWRELRRAFSGRYDPFRVIGSQALGKNFRLSDLRSLYEVIRGQKIQSDQFRRMTTGEHGFIEAAGSLDTSGSRPGKPATMFRLKDWAIPKSGHQPTQ